MGKSLSESLAQIEMDFPDKKYFTIGEVSELCGLKSHVLRYWEQVFPQLQPSKRRGRRYYQKQDLEVLIEIKSLLQDQGFTIQGAKARLKIQNAQDMPLLSDETATQSEVSLLADLQQIRQDLHTFIDYINKKYH